MARLYLDDGIIEDSILQREDKEDFIERKRQFNEQTLKYINEHYKGEDSENVYALFDAEQKKLLQSYFKNFSAEMYKELNGTVELQIQKKNAKVREKIENLGKIMGKISLDDWEYDGMVDAGQNAGQKCDLCPRPVRYAHFAVNRKTKECLRFGCSCAADFFSLDSTTLSSMKTIQAKTLKDIRLISYIMEHNLLKEYYLYMCGYTGKVVLEKGEDGIRDLMTFLVVWEKDKKGIVHQDGGYVVKFGDGNTAVKSMIWIKDNITSCLNADLDDNINQKASERDLVPIAVKNEDKVQANTTAYVNFAIRFLRLGLPIPQEIAKKLNSIVARTARTHHPDYIKYAEELLMSSNLSKSNLLRTAFTDFIVNYLASSMKMVERDEEAASWGIKGQKTFYNTVLTWEGAILKLMVIREVRTLVNKGLISEDEVDRLLGKGTRYSVDYEKMKDFLDKCLRLFMTNKEVIKKEENVNAGFSKYMIEGVDDKIGITKELDSYHLRTYYYFDKFNANTIPINIGSYYRKIQSGYRTMITDSLRPVLQILKGSLAMEKDIDFVMYLSLLKNQTYRYVGVQHESIDIANNYSRDFDADVKKRMEQAINEGRIDTEFCKELYEKNIKVIRKLRKDFEKLYDEVTKLLDGMVQYKLPDSLPAKVNDDFESLIFEETKTYRDYFIDYCNMLTAKRGNKGIQKNLLQQNLYGLIPFKLLEPYEPIFNAIQENFINQKRKEEEAKLFREFGLYNLKTELKKILGSHNMTEFMQLITILATRINYSAKKYLIQDISDGVIVIDMQIKDEPMSDKDLVERMNKVVSKEFIEYCQTKHAETFKKMYDGMKEVFIGIKKEKLTYKEYYNMLENNSRLIEGRMDYIATLDEFEGLLRKELNIESIYKGGNSNIPTLLAYLDNFKGMNGIAEEFDKLLEEYLSVKIKEDQEKDKKKGFVEEIEKMCDERIRFFEAPIDDLKKKYPTYSESGLRRKYAEFNYVKWDDKYTVIPKFTSELETDGNLSDEIIKLIADARKASGDIEYKKYSEGLRVEMYNRKLIYSHFNVTYLTIKDLRNFDLYKISNDDLLRITKLIGSYYILKSHLETLVEILNKYGNLTFDYNEEVKKIPEPEQRSVADVIKEFSDDADSTGYTGLQKAEMIVNHPDFNEKVSDGPKKIVKSVVYYKRCSKNQLPYVNIAFKELGLGNPDEVKIEQNDNEKELIKLAEEIIVHPNFEKEVSSFAKKVVKSVAVGKSCKGKQANWVLTAAKEVGIR